MRTPIRALHHPVQDDVAGKRLRVETDYPDYVQQLIEQVLLTNPGERIYKPEFGAGIRRLVHSPITAATATLAQTMIYNALSETLGDLIRVDDVQVENVDARLNVAIVYTLYARMDQRHLNLEVTS
ncbi:GPW/gp25 family protein [Enhygromyxa salina]|nr:GPW/gp25 family protein [Enhygromyxa salina]